MMMFDNLTAQTMFMGVAMLFSIVNAIFAAFFWRMRATFPTKEEVDASFVAVRNENVLRIEGIQDSISQFDARLRRVEADASGLAAEIKGISNMVGRVDHMVGLLVEFRIRETAHD